ARDNKAEAETESRDLDEALNAPPPAPTQESAIASGNAQNQVLMRGIAETEAAGRTRDMAQPKLYAPSAAVTPAPADMPAPQAENRDRVEDFNSEPVRPALEDPVSTFSTAVETAAYAV